EVVKDAIGMAAYTMDSHNAQRVVVNGMVKNEGNVEIGGFPPYPVSYRSITPRRKECTNLLVPVCLSASHIAYGSIRMEPVFMVLAQSSAIAAAEAIDAKKAVQEVDVQKIQKKLINDPLLDGSHVTGNK
ncbi:MAG: FAD-dependent oxidoreductase, partial [Bacteroidota bacterium]|nr:FAD-dependent oxidoreductase [Bacteroidota bacterium]